MSIRITPNLTLRNFYTGNRNLVNETERSNAKQNELSFADASALRRAVRALGDYEYKDAKKEDLSEKLKAFLDTYNNTIDSSAQSSDENVSAAVKNIKRLTEQYADDLKELGISIDSQGILSLSSSATTNIRGERFAPPLWKRFGIHEKTFFLRQTHYEPRQRLSVMRVHAKGPSFI